MSDSSRVRRTVFSYGTIGPKADKTVVRAARVPVVGRASVAKFIAAIASHFWTGVTLEWIEANAQASVVILRDGAVVGLVTITASVQGIDQIMWVMRPSKLAAISFSLLASRAQ